MRGTIYCAGVARRRNASIYPSTERIRLIHFGEYGNNEGHWTESKALCMSSFVVHQGETMVL